MSFGAAFGAFGESLAKATLMAKKATDDKEKATKDAFSTTTPTNGAATGDVTPAADAPSTNTTVAAKGANGADATVSSSVAQVTPSSGGSGSTPDAYDLSRIAVGGGLRQDAISGLDPNFRNSFSRMIAEAPEEVRSGVRISSAYRSPQVQAEIIAKNMQKYGFGAEDRARWQADVKALGPEAAGDKWRSMFRPRGLTKFIGMPGRSNHQMGRAMDLKYLNPSAKKWVHANAGKYGMQLPMAHEDWHIEPQRQLASRGLTPGS